MGSESLQNLNGRDLERLAALSAVSRTINSSYRLDEVLSRVMDVAREALGAQRGFVMLDRGGERPEVVVARGLDPEHPDGAEAYSSTVVRRVLDRGEPLLSNSALTDQRFSESGSLRLLGVRSVLCAPMRTRGRVQGLLYLDRTDRSASFTPMDLELLKIIADLAVAAIERVLYFESVAQAQKMAAMGTLLATVSHEIRNPITVILTCSHLLKNYLAEVPEALELTDGIQQEAERCRDLAQKLLGLGRRNGGTREPVAPGPLVEGVARFAGQEIRLAGVEFQVHVEPDIPPVRMETGEITQVLLNLLRNAREAVEGRETPRITLALRRGPGCVRLVVADNGPGIPEEHQSRLFEPFFTTRQAQGGTGLGLYVSCTIVSEHGGTLRAHNDPEAGAVFTVELPLEEPEAPPAPGPDLPLDPRISWEPEPDEDDDESPPPR